MNNFIKVIKKYLFITVASFLFGAGISLFIDPNNLAPGGISGLSIILSRIVPVDTGTIFLIVNIPIIALGIWKFGWRFIISTLYATFMVSTATNVFKLMKPLTNDPLLAAIFGSIMMAIGMGTVLRHGATTGGTDIIVKCLRLKFLHLKTGTLFLLIDMVIIGISGFVFDNIDSVLYSAIAAATTSYVLDLVLYGKDGAKMIYIISDASDIITERLLAEVSIGVTHLTGSGAYKKENKKVILCAVKKTMAHKVEAIVKQEDPEAFMIISSAAEIYGEGYKSYFGEVL